MLFVLDFSNALNMSSIYPLSLSYLIQTSLYDPLLYGLNDSAELWYWVSQMCC